MERAGIDIIIDGEIRRESYSNRLATALAGVDLDNPATVMGRSGGTVVVPRITGPIRGMPVELRNVELLRANTDRTIKITLPGPFTMSRQAKQLTGGYGPITPSTTPATRNGGANALPRSAAGVLTSVA